MASHKVPTHLDAPDGIGRYSFRRLGLVFGGFFLETEIIPHVPPIGPALGDLIRLRYQHLGIEAGWFPLLPTLAAIAAAAPIVALARTANPPAEHGLSTSARWLKQRGIVPQDTVRDIIGNPEVDRDSDVVTSDFGFHAVWELPSRNLRLADQAEVEIAEEAWGRFLSGLSAPIQTLVTSRRVDADQLVARFEAHPRLQSRRLANWLRTWVADRRLIDRRHFLAITADDRQKFSDSIDEIVEGLPTLGLRTDLIRRLAGSELRLIVRRAWSPSKTVGQDLAPVTPWNIHPRQIESDLESHEVMVLGKWPRLIRDNALAPFIDGPYDVDTIQHITPVDPDNVLEKLERRLDGMSASKPNQKRTIAIKDMEGFTLSVESGEELPFDVVTLFHIHNANRKEVQAEAKRLASRVKRTGAEAQNLRWEQASALVAVAPLAINELKRRTKRVDTSSIANAYPFSASAMWPEGAVPFGESLESRRPVGLTVWARPLIATPSLFVAANSGGGKGFGVKVGLSRSLFAGETHEIYGFDQATEDEALGEYGRFAEYCGLEYRFIRTLADVEPALRDLRRPGVIWNIAGLPMADRPEMLIKTKEVLWKLAARLKRRRQLIVDELYAFVKSAAAMNADPAIVALSHAALDDLARQGRHMLLGAVWMTQRVRDSIEQPIVQVIQSQAASQLYGVQNPADITTITPLLQWTPAEAAAVRRFIPGHFLYVAGPWRVTMRVTASDEEFEMANTDGKVDRESATPTTVSELALDFEPPYREPGNDRRNGHSSPLAVPAQQPEAIPT